MTRFYINRIEGMRQKLAYLAGLIGADGSLEVEDPFITISSSDRDFLEKRVLPYLEAIARRKIRIFMDRSANVYKLRIYHRRLWRLLVEKYKIPCGAKSRSISPPVTLTRSEQVLCVQGWFDGEGWIEVLRTRSPKIYRYPRIGFKVRSKAIRDWIFDVLSKQGVPATTYNRAEGTFGIWINGKSACELFMRHIRFGYAKKNKALKALVAMCRRPVSA